MRCADQQADVHVLRRNARCTTRRDVAAAHAQSCAHDPAVGASICGDNLLSGDARAVDCRLGTPRNTCPDARAGMVGIPNRDSRKVAVAAECNRLACETHRLRSHDDGAANRANCVAAQAHGNEEIRRARRVTFAVETELPLREDSRPAAATRCDVEHGSAEAEIRQRLMAIESHLCNLRKRALRPLPTTGGELAPQEHLRSRPAGALPCRRERKRNL